MRLRYWLSDVFQEEATGAGEGAVGTVAEPSAAVDTGEPPQKLDVEAAVAKWAGTQEPSEPAPKSEPKEIPVEPVSADAVSDDDADDEPIVEETGQDPLLMNLLEAYDYSPEDVTGFSNDDLKRLLAREQRRHGTQPQAADNPPPEAKEQPAAKAAPAAPASTAADSTPTMATFADVQKELEAKLSEEGFSADAIAREVRLAKLRWEREEAILTDARSARQEAEQVRQLYQQREVEHARQLEVNTLLDMADNFAEMGYADLLGKPTAEWTQAQKDARMKFVQAYDVLKAINPQESLKRIAQRAFHTAFAEAIQKREIKSQARKIIKQASNVIGQGLPTKAISTADKNWMSNPKIARISQRMKANAGM